MLYKNKNARSAIPGYSLVPKGEYYQVHKIGLTPKQVRTHPAFSKTRKMAEEFAAVARLGKVIRDAFLEGTGIQQHPKVLNSALKKVLHTDQVYPPGSRVFRHATIDLLKGYHFNQQAPLQQALKFEFTVYPGMEQQILQVTIPACIPTRDVVTPIGYTHFRLVFTLVTVNTEEGTATRQTKRTTLIPSKQIPIVKQDITFQTREERGNWQLLAVSVQWYSAAGRSKQLSRSAMPGPLTIIDTCQIDLQVKKNLKD